MARSVIIIPPKLHSSPRVIKKKMKRRSYTTSKTSKLVSTRIERLSHGSNFPSSLRCKPQYTCRIMSRVPSLRMYGLPYYFEIFGLKNIIFS